MPTVVIGGESPQSDREIETRHRVDRDAGREPGGIGVDPLGQLGIAVPGEPLDHGLRSPGRGGGRDEGVPQGVEVRPAAEVVVLGDARRLEIGPEFGDGRTASVEALVVVTAVSHASLADECSRPSGGEATHPPVRVRSRAGSGFREVGLRGLEGPCGPDKRHRRVLACQC